MNIDARAGDDDFALAAQEAQLAGGLGLGQIAGGEPLVFALPQLAARPGGAGDHGAAHQHFAVRADLHFTPGERLADRALRHFERMIERDERGGFGHAVALHDDEAERVPELLDRRQAARRRRR